MHIATTEQPVKKQKTNRTKAVSKHKKVNLDLFGNHKVISVIQGVKPYKKTKKPTKCNYIACPTIFSDSHFVYRRFQKSDFEAIKDIPVELPSKRPIYIGEDIHIQPNCIIAVPAFTDNSFRGGHKSQQSRDNLKCNRVKGELSQASKRKLNRSVNWLVAAAKNYKVWSKQKKKHFNFKCAFITLTLPSWDGQLTDEQFKKYMLAKFIDWMRKTKCVRNYIWKVELQHNGRIHAHIVINQFIHYNDVRREWLKICNEYGLVAKEDYEDNMQAVPCTEIKAVRNVKKLGAYVAKYLSKSDNDKNKVGPQRLIKGRLWSCNWELSSSNKLVVRADGYDTGTLLSWWEEKSVKVRKIESYNKTTKSSRVVGGMVFLTAKDWRKQVCDELVELYKNHIWNIQSGMQSLPISYYQI